jgi:hypothetical protein
VNLLDAGNAVMTSHPLADEPLLTLEALADAADRLPRDKVVQRAGNQPLLAAERFTSPSERPSDLTRDVAARDRWMRLTSLTVLPEYAALLRRGAGQFELMVRARGERILAHDLLAFVAGPGTTVPIHFDRDHQLLMQIRGTKTVGIGTYTDPRVAQLQIERAFGPRPLGPSMHPDRSETRVLHPGDALLIAASTFHWVDNGNDDVSIALTCVARTDRTTRDAAVHRFNRRARCLGLRPSPPRCNLAVDRAKEQLIRVTVRQRRGA